VIVSSWTTDEVAPRFVRPRANRSTVNVGSDDLLKEALQLSEQERARVAAELLASLDPDVETRDGEAWIAEVERRAQAAIDGLPGLGWDETRKRVEERIGRTRK
jgi:putative addiction module component